MIRLLLPYFLTVIITGGAGWWIHGLLMDRQEFYWQDQLRTRTAKVEADCKETIKLSQEVSDGLQTRIIDLDRKLANAARLRKQQCVVVGAASTTTGVNAASNSAGLSGNHGIPAAALIDFAGQAEKTGLQLDACQDFIRRVWAKNGQ